MDGKIAGMKNLFKLWVSAGLISLVCAGCGDDNNKQDPVIFSQTGEGMNVTENVIHGYYEGFESEANVQFRIRMKIEPERLTMGNECQFSESEKIRVQISSPA